MRRKLVRGADGKISFVDLPDALEYFFPMGNSEREIVANWFKLQRGVTEKQEEFLERVKTALEVVTYDYSIATIEPSQDENGKVYYEVGKPVLRGLSYNEWLKKAKEFMPEMGSDLATLYELFLWYAYRIAKGYWTLKYVCDDSSSAGNYLNAPNAKHACEPSGIRKVGGFYDGIGNITKVVRDCESGFCFCGGNWTSTGNGWPMADVSHKKTNMCEYKSAYITGCVVIRK